MKSRLIKLVRLLGKIQTVALVNMFYLFIVPVFSLIRLFDPLEKNVTPKKSFFKKRQLIKNVLKDYLHPF